MEMDASQQGLLMFFKDYQVEAVNYLWRAPPTGAGSRDVWENVNHVLSGSISRASIINFLNEMVDIGLLEYHEITGKGGHRRIYHHKYGEPEFKKEIVARFIGKLLKSFPDETNMVLEHLSN
jgi:hypothetical protein